MKENKEGRREGGKKKEMNLNQKEEMNLNHDSCGLWLILV
jgi:hypothetical protein